MLEKQNKYSIRKLTVGAASVLIGASFFAVNGKTVEADTVNNTNNVDVNKVVQESTGEKAPESTQDGLLKGTDKIEKNSGVESGTNTNTSDAPVNQDNPATKDSQHSGEADTNDMQLKQANTGMQLNTSSNHTDGTLQTSVPAKQGALAIGTMQNQDNTVNNGVKVPETQTLNLKRVQNIKLNAVSLQDSKVQTQNIATNGGFDEATWGKLDVNNWKGQAENGVYQLTDYTGDLAHIIVPNAADFAAAGKDIGKLQVGIDADTTHSWFEKGDPKTIAFSKTGGEKVKAVGGDWTSAFTGSYDRHEKLEHKSHSLVKFDGNNLDVSNVTDMKYMFVRNQLTDLTGLTNWNVGNVTDMQRMFVGNRLTNLTGLDNWNVNKVINMSAMFYDNQLTNLTSLAKWNVGNVTDMSEMFGHNRLTNLTGLDKWYVGNVTNMDNMFADNQLTNLTELTNWDVGNVTEMLHMFDNNKLSNLSGLAKWNVGNVTDMSSMFSTNCLTDLTGLTNWNVNKVANMSDMFFNNQLANLTGLTNWDVGNVTDMSEMFANNQLTDLTDLANWNVNKVANMSNMFWTNKLADLTCLTKWNVGNVTDMSGMFQNNQLVNLTGLTKWNVSNVTDMSSMLQNNQLTDLSDLTNWNVGNVFNMVGMFADNQLTDLSDLTNWNVGNVTDMSYMFYNNHIAFANFTKWNFDQIDFLDSFINQNNNAIILVKDIKDQTKLSGASQTAANNFSFKNASVTDTVSMPTILVATDKEAARRQLLDQINQKVQEYQKAHPNMGAIPVTPLNNLTTLADLANAKFNVVPNITVTVHFFDDIGTNQDNAPKDITLNNQVVGQVLTIDAIKDNPELANYNLVPGASYTVAENTPWLVHVTHKISEHDTSLPATRTIRVHRPDGTTQTTVQTIGYKYTVTHDLVTNQDFNSEPIFDKDTTETVVTTVDKNGESTSQTDKSTIFYTKASDGKYYNFNSFKLPTFPGYKIHMTANSSGIEISYARQHLNTINFVDSTNPSNIVKTYNVSGFTGQTVATDINDNIPENWEIVPDNDYPSNIAFSTNDQEDTPINVQVQHKYVDVTTGDGTTETLSRNIYAGKTDFRGSTSGQELEKIRTQTVTLHRTGTKDLVTGEVKWNPYSSGTFEAISAPVMPGYTLSNPNDCKPLTVDGSSNVDDVYLVYKPNKHTQVFNYVDKNGTVEGTYSVDGYTDQTFPVDTSYITNNIPSGWMQVPGSTYPLTLTFGPDDPAPINVQVQSRYANVTTGEGTSIDLHRDIYTDAVDFTGSILSSNKIGTQTITLHRTGTKDLVTGTIEWNPYSSGTFKAIIAPAMSGYTLMNPENCTPVPVDGSLIVDGSSNAYDVHLIYRQDYVASGNYAGDMFTSDFVIMPTNSATNFAIMPTDSTSLTLPKIADSVQVTQSKNVQKEDDAIQRTVKPHAAISKQELDSLVKTAALPSVKLNKQNLKELKQIFVNNNPQDLRSISWKLQDSALNSSTPLYTLSNSSNSIMLPNLTGYKFKLIKRGTGENSVSFVYSKDKNYKYVFNIAFKDNVIYFTVLAPNKAYNKLTVKQVYKVHNQKELANILSLYL